MEKLTANGQEPIAKELTQTSQNTQTIRLYNTINETWIKIRRIRTRRLVLAIRREIGC
jgi:hypothetical protein